jgi:hypothetical protein
MTATVSNYPYFHEERVSYFHGTCEVYTPVTEGDMAGGSHVETVTCPHRHQTTEAAKECAQALARKRARELNGGAS